MRMNGSLDGERWKSPEKKKNIYMYFYLFIYIYTYIYINNIYINIYKSLTQL